MKECVVCQKVNSNYRCPTCRLHYCSVSCCTTHKLNCETQTNQTKVEGEKGAGHGDRPSNSDGIVPVESIKIQDNQSKKIMQISSDTDQQRILTTEEKQKLADSSELLERLKSKRLRNELIKIDTAENRQEELKKLRKNSEFDHFISFLLSTLEEGKTPE